MVSPCRLDALAGRDTRCPGDPCPFWDPGGAVLEGICMFDQVDLAGRPAVVSELLQLRARLEGAVDAAGDGISERDGA